MSEQRLIDANALKKKMQGTNRYFRIVFDIEKAPTIDPETLPIVRELLAKIGNMEDNERYMRKQLDNLREKLKKANKTAENWENCLSHEIETRTELEKKLSRYEQTEQEGRLVKLPCEVGRTVYTLFCGEVVEKRIGRFYINGYTNPVLWADIDCDFLGTQIERWDLVIGKTVFLTREEAEAALKERENDGL